MPVGVNRLLYQAFPFPGEVKYFLQSARRTHPIYITYPFEQMDDITLQLPKSMRVESVPDPKNNTTPFGTYSLTIENNGTSVHIQRHFSMRAGLIGPQYYSLLRGFLTSVRQADDNQMVLKSVPPSTSGGGR
jgi:hypothetical protein